MFSVLIANYNNAKYLPNAIESVVSQTYKDWEIIIVDDGSTDNSDEIYRLYASNYNIKVFHNERNMGCTYTKWRCVEESNGEICGFLDADDALREDALEKMVNAHQHHPTASIITSRCYYCDEKMAVKGESRLLRIPEGESYLTYGDYQPEHFTSFKKSFYKKTNGLNKKNKIGDDQELNLILEEVGDWVVLDDFLYYYRDSIKSISKTNSMECYYWNTIIRHEACARREIGYGVAYNSFIDACKIFSLENVELEKTKIRSSKSYRLGYFLLHPLSIFKKK